MAQHRLDKQKDGEWGSWALIVFLFAIGIWPVALLLLFAKLFGNDHHQKQRSVEPVSDQWGQIPYRLDTDLRQSQAKARAAVKKVIRSPGFKKSNARWLKILGVILAVGGLVTAYDPVSKMYLLDGVRNYYILEAMQYLAVSVAGLGMLAGGISMDRSMKRYVRYLAVMGDLEAISVQELSRKIGYSERHIGKDLEKMIDRGYFGGRAYLDAELGYFFRSSQAEEELRRKTVQPDETPKEAEEGYSGILRNIRRANDQIADPELSAKIDRLEEIAAKIFHAVEGDPKKRGRIDTFLNYYLPTTQKLLDSYAEFEAAGVEGENLRQAKERIRTTMDSIVKGFEHQLDELYKADVMDVDSDIRVMESMLNRDTASVERDFGLGKSASQTGCKSAAKDVDLGGMAAQEEQD